MGKGYKTMTNREKFAEQILDIACSGCKYEKSTNIKELLAFCTHCKRAYSREEDREIHEDRYEAEESEE